MGEASELEPFKEDALPLREQSSVRAPSVHSSFVKGESAGSEHPGLICTQGLGADTTAGIINFSLGVTETQHF